MKFCKIFNLKNGGQVLAHLSNNTETEETELKLKTFIYDVELETTMTFEGEDTAEKALESFDLDSALRFYEGMDKLLN